ncbi:multiple epidermal growth factor-like domains protein 11 [Dreissena polymorpha]|uniref:Uncharacterized protein n=1 Tax=Dreissena polymorpha TaxID=45954 RepID=A0A9D4MTK6_DREPO|nr:multiple epidermal growth factor-like domains protein 11 [Dreissena polymorpha]KAH3881007.1 hypothetical protein DPMN_004930 [Dreissena polymorpha]
MEYQKLRILTLCIIACIVYVSGRPCDVDKVGIHRFGKNCSLRCHCRNNESCDEAGACANGCAPGMFGPGCQYVDIAHDDPEVARHSDNLEFLDHQYANLAVDPDLSTCSFTKEAASQTGHPWWSHWFPYDVIFTYIEFYVHLNYTEFMSHYRVSVANLSKEHHSNKQLLATERLCNEIGVDDEKLKMPTSGTLAVIGVFCREPVVGNTIRIELLRSRSQLVLCDVNISQGRNMAFSKSTNASSISEGDLVHITDDIVQVKRDECFVSRKDNSSWLMIDFGAKVQITQIHIVPFKRENNLNGYHIDVKEIDQDLLRNVYQDSSINSKGSEQDTLNITFVTTSLYITRRGHNPSKIAVCEVRAFGDCPESSCGYDCSEECYCRPPYTLFDKIAGRCPHDCLNDSRWTYRCDQVCNVNHWGNGCSHTCGHCANGLPCDVQTGRCPQGCLNDSRWTDRCDQVCNANHWGNGCNHTCGHCANGLPCDVQTGRCLEGCEPGYQNTTFCKENCEAGTFGQNCSQNCSKHCQGPCNHVNGHCACKPGYLSPNCSDACKAGTFGLNCSTKCSHNCNGICNHETGYCACKAGYRAPNCSADCEAGTFGQNCSQNCSKNCQGPCNHVNGHCVCKPGFMSPNCSHACKAGTFGSNCSTKCSHNCNGNCNHETGYCACKAGYRAPNCSADCEAGTFGQNCSQNCSKHCQGPCNHVNGHCACKPGYLSPNCSHACKAGTFGLNCSTKCSHNCNGNCNHETGYCACKSGYRAPNCSAVCGAGTFGQNCSQNCSNNCQGLCDHVTGHCACKSGYRSPNCSYACEIGKFGQNCSQNCSTNCQGLCEHVSGYCTCKPGYRSPYCLDVCEPGSFGEN